MAEASAGSNALQSVPVFNAIIPKEGPKSLPVTCDFSVVATYDIDLTLVQTQQRMSVVQAVFVDNTANAQKTTITINGNSQTLVIPAGAQAYLPLLCAKPTIITVASTGAVVVPMIFLNVPAPSVVWDTTAASSPSLSSVYADSTFFPANLTVVGGVDGTLVKQAIPMSVDGTGNVNVNVVSSVASSGIPTGGTLTTITVSNGDGDVTLVSPQSSPSYASDLTLTNTDPTNAVIINYGTTGDGAFGMVLPPNGTLHINAVNPSSSLVAYSSAGGASSNINVAYSVLG